MPGQPHISNYLGIKTKHTYLCHLVVLILLDVQTYQYSSSMFIVLSCPLWSQLPLLVSNEHSTHSPLGAFLRAISCIIRICVSPLIVSAPPSIHHSGHEWSLELTSFSHLIRGYLLKTHPNHVLHSSSSNAHTPIHTLIPTSTLPPQTNIHKHTHTV